MQWKENQKQKKHFQHQRYIHQHVDTRALTNGGWYVENGSVILADRGPQLGIFFDALLQIPMPVHTYT